MASANKNECQPIRLLMLPWLAYGHITPYLELAKRLTKRGSFITYICSTPANLTCIDKKITHTFSKSIKLIPLNLPITPDLPSNLHTTNHLPPHLMQNLHEAFNSSVNDFSIILIDLKPDLLIYDFQPWAYNAAKEQNIPAVQFTISSCTSMCFTFHYFKNPTVEFPSSKICFRDYEQDGKKWLLETAANKEEMDRVFDEIEKSSKIVLIKGFRDMEGKYIDYLSSLVGRKYVPLGPLVEEPSHDDDDDEILSWLDMKERRSTILVSFGSEYFLNKEERDEIAHGLEVVISKNINFIWVLRFPKCDNGKDGLLEKTLPVGFLERVGSRGRILEWAPQTRILGHPSIGGFVSHCGLSSVMESMNLGVPIIGVPMHLDQPINARLVEEVGVGVEVLRDKEKKLRGETLAAVIEHVVREDSGEFVRQRAAEMGEKLRSRGDEEIDEVVEMLVGLCNKSSDKE